MAFPTITVRAALASDPFASGPSYTDLSAYFMGATIRRGRQDSLQQFEPGRATITLDNRDRRFDFFTTGGPYTTTFRPGKRVQIEANYSGTDYPIFTGYIDRIRLVWPSPADAMVEVELVDAFSILNRKDLLRNNYSTEVLAGSPAAYYRMDDPAGSTVMTDSSGNGYDGNYGGTNGKVDAPGGVHGDPGASMNCGSGERYASGATLSGFTGASPHMVEMLVFYIGIPPIAAPPEPGRILFEQDIGGGNRFVVRVQSDSQVRVDCPGGPVTSTAALTQFAWNYVAAGIDGSNNIRLRVNNAAVVTGTYTGGSMTQNYTDIGGGPSGLTFFGWVDEVATYNGAIPTDSDTLTHYGWSSAALGVQLGHDRIGALLDHIGWPAGDRSFTSSVHHLAPVIEPLAGQSLLAYFQDIARTEFGLLYVNGAGQIVFGDEQSASPPSSVATFGEGSGEIHYPEGPGAEYSLEFVANEISVRVQRVPSVPGLSDGYATDAASVTAYGPRGLTVDGLMFNSQTGVDNRADDLLALRKDPKKRIKTVKVRAQDDTANTLPVLLGTELGDTVTVKRTPVGGGSAISVVSLVDGISHTIGPDTWVTEFALSPW